jgi:uncharacterized protein YegP (UPF0339 family)
MIYKGTNGSYRANLVAAGEFMQLKSRRGYEKADMVN